MAAGVEDLAKSLTEMEIGNENIIQYNRDELLKFETLPLSRVQIQIENLSVRKSISKTQKSQLKKEPYLVTAEGAQSGMLTSPQLNQGLVTVTTEEEVKHKLQNIWKFWYFEEDKNMGWEDNLRVVAQCDTVEDFWSIYNSISRAAELCKSYSYFMFKNGIKPIWEDPKNRRGRRWIINLDKKFTKLDSTWLELLLCLVGESFGKYGADICGVVVDVRGKIYKISIRTLDFKNKESILNIGEKIKERLELNINLKMKYEEHVNGGRTKSGHRKHLFQLQLQQSISA